MKSKLFHPVVLLTAAAFLAPAAPLSAAQVDRRVDRQEKRIEEGAESGELTPAELARLEAREAALKKQIADNRSENGGKLTRAERRQIKRELDRISHRIRRAKHNDRAAPGS